MLAAGDGSLLRLRPKPGRGQRRAAEVHTAAARRQLPSAAGCAPARRCTSSPRRGAGRVPATLRGCLCVPREARRTVTRRRRGTIADAKERVRHPDRPAVKRPRQGAARAPSPTASHAPSCAACLARPGVELRRAALLCPRQVQERPRVEARRCMPRRPGEGGTCGVVKSNARHAHEDAAGFKVWHRR
jgi:hypothetical protein